MVIEGGREGQTFDRACSRSAAAVILNVLVKAIVGFLELPFDLF
jgi:hypothetical protein